MPGQKVKHYSLQAQLADMSKKKNTPSWTKVANLLINNPHTEMPKEYGKFFLAEAKAIDKRIKDKAKKTLPMNFSYGKNSLPGTKATTFQEIFEGKRRSTLRKVGTHGLKVGELVDVKDKAGNIGEVKVTGIRRVDASMAEELSKTERWTPKFIRNYIKSGNWEQVSYEPTTKARTKMAKVTKITGSPSQYIEIKGPFQLRSREAGDKVVKEAMRLAKEHPKAKFILRETARNQGFGSVYSNVFKAFTQKKMGDRIKVVKANYKTQFSHLGPPSDVREAKISSLKPFKTAEFTFSGNIVSAEYKRWREVDISLSEEKHWDPLKSKGQHFQSFKGYNEKTYHVQKYPGGSSSATKKVDAFLDRISEYGRKKGAKQTSVDAAIQYIIDKNDEFVETQRYSKDPKYKNKEPIHMLSKDRLKRLDRLQKNYGTPPKQPGNVNITGTGEKQIKKQVDVGDTVPTFETKTIAQQSAPRITTSANAPSPVKTPLKMKSISPASFRLAEKLKAKLETNQTTVTKPSEGVTKTRHVRKIKTSQVVETGTEQLKPVESVREGKPPKYPEGVEPEQRGQVKTGLRESGTSTSFDPVGISSEIDSAREFDEHSKMSKDADAPRYPEQSSDRVTFPADQKPLKNVKPIKYPAVTTIARFDPKNRKYTQFGYTESKKPEHLTPAQKKEYRKQGLKVPTKTAVVVHPFSQMKSGLVQWDKYKRPDLEVAPGEKLTTKDWEVDMGIDKGGGEHYSAHTDEFMDAKQQALRDEIAKPGKKGELPPTAIARKPWLNPKLKVGDTKKTTPTTTLEDALYGDSQSIEVDHATGETYKTSSATSPHNVGDAIPAYKHGDPETIGKKKRKESNVRKQQRRLENLRTETSHIEIKHNKKTGKEYFVLKKNPGYEDLSIQQEFDKTAAKRKAQGTRAEQIERNYVRFRNKSIKDLNKKQIDTEIKHPKVDEWGRPVPLTDKDHGPMKRTFVLKKPNTAAKTPKKTTGSLIQKAFGISKTGAKVLTPLALLGLTPWVAEQNLEAAEIDDPTASQRIQENLSVFFGSDRFISGVNKPPGYIQSLVKHDIPAMRKFGKSTGDFNPIKGAGGPNTPYAKLKAWMFSKPKTTLPYKSDMATKTDW